MLALTNVVDTHVVYILQNDFKFPNHCLQCYSGAYLGPYQISTMVILLGK